MSEPDWLLGVWRRHGRRWHVVMTSVGLVSAMAMVVVASVVAAAHDEFVTISRHHVHALSALDQYPDLRFLDRARGTSVDEAVLLAYADHVDQFSPFDLEDRLDQPEPEGCPDCGRPTFLPKEWDDFGGTNSPAECVACGYERSESEAWDLALDAEIQRHRDD